jgi:hypothetical protein
MLRELVDFIIDTIPVTVPCKENRDELYCMDFEYTAVEVYIIVSSLKV